MSLAGTREDRTDMAIIQDPGKFEGEPSWAPILWDWTANGMQDETFYDGEMPIDVYAITADCVASLRAAGCDADDETELRGVIGQTILLWETEQGFVETRIVDATELARIQRDCADTANSETDEGDDA